MKEEAIARFDYPEELKEKLVAPIVLLVILVISYLSREKLLKAEVANTAL